MGRNGKRQLPKDKGSHCQECHQATPLLWPKETSHSTGRCLPKRTWCMLTTGWPANCICQQEPNRHWDQVRKHQKESSLPLYSLVNSSTPMYWEGHLQWSPITSHWKWYTRRALPVPLPDCNECSSSYSDTLWPSDTDQGRKCCSQMHWAGAPHKLLGKSNWIWESITLPSARPG